MEISELKLKNTSQNKRIDFEDARNLGYLYQELINGKITMEDLMETSIPSLVALTNNSIEAFYKSMKIDTYSNVIEWRERKLRYKANRYFGIDNIIECFLESINNFNINLVNNLDISKNEIEDGYDKGDLLALNFTRYFKTQLCGKISNGQRMAKSRSTVIIDGELKSIKQISINSEEVLEIMNNLNSEEFNIVFDLDMEMAIIEFSKSDFIKKTELRKALLMELCYVMKDSHINKKVNNYMKMSVMASIFNVSETTIKRERHKVREEFKKILIKRQILKETM